MQIISDGSEENLKNLMAMKKVLYFLVATREFGEKHDKGGVLSKGRGIN